jgi:hypothetical protein
MYIYKTSNFSVTKNVYRLKLFGSLRERAPGLLARLNPLPLIRPCICMIRKNLKIKIIQN